MSLWTIREEREGDAPGIAALTRVAFHAMAFSNGQEVEIVNRLRNAGALTISLVAENYDKAIIGHVAFSPVTLSGGEDGWYGLGPISVIPLRQRVGIGSELVEGGLEKLRRMGAAGCVVLGDPSYYGRFGFVHDPALAYPGPPATYFQHLLIKGALPSGTVSYHPAFDE